MFEGMIVLVISDIFYPYREVAMLIICESLKKSVQEDRSMVFVMVVSVQIVLCVLPIR